MKKLIDDLRVVLKIIPSTQVMSLLDGVTDIVSDHEDDFEAKDLRKFRDKYEWFIDKVEEDREFDPVVAGQLANAVERLSKQIKKSPDAASTLAALADKLHGWVESGVGLE